MAPRPARNSLPPGLVNPGSEAALAVALLIDATAPVAASGAMVVLTAFSLGISRALRRGRSVDCGCFGKDSSPVSNGSLMRNAGLIVLAVPVAVGGSGGSLISGHPCQPVLAVIALTALTGLAIHCLRLLSRNRRLSQRADHRDGLAKALAAGRSSTSG